MNRKTIVTIAVAAALGGGAAGVVLLSPALANAGNRAVQAPAAGPSGAPDGPGGGTPGGRGPGHGGPGGPHERVSDESVVAKAIGISAADLDAAVAKGQTWAQVAQAHGVAVQKVVDALVADAKSELADEVKTGRITQAQADAAQAGLVQRVTDQVNGTHPNSGGPGRPDDNDADDRGGNPPAPAPGAS